MKAFVRSAFVQHALAFFLAGYLKAVYLTIRWERVGQERAQSIWDRKHETGAILCFWHAMIPISPNCWRPRDGGQAMRALISKSSDGEFITLTVAKLGFPAIRGSRKREDSVGEKGGAEAFREMIKWVRGKGGIAVTPDGPAGPAQLMGEGVPTLARLTGAPVLFVGLACKPCIRINSWDRTVVPLPFAKGVMVWDGPVTVQKGDDFSSLAADWGARLIAVTDQAEAMVK